MQRSEALAILEDALDDTDNQVWSATELEFLLDSALAQVNQLRPRAVRDEIDLVDDTDLYTLENVHTVTRIDWLDENGRFIRVVPPQAWEVWGVNDDDEFQVDGTMQQVNINLRWARTGYAIRVHGYGPWVWDDE